MSSEERSGWAAGVVRRPVTVLTLVLAVAVFGTLAAERLPSELLPDLSYPTLTVQTTYPDAAPTSVAAVCSTDYANSKLHSNTPPD